MESPIHTIMYALRWLLAPIYFCLSLVLLFLSIKFIQEVFLIFPQILTISKMNVILAALSLIDMALVAGLLVMVMFTGYENFISKMKLKDTDNRLSWLGKLDANALKLKIAASIVAISSIHLLSIFMDAISIPNEKIMWYVIIHLTFVFSAFIMGYLDKISKSSENV
jgi:uncharacterized protein (TIGR00645 family)